MDHGHFEEVLMSPLADVHVEKVAFDLRKHFARTARLPLQVINIAMQDVHRPIYLGKWVDSQL